MVLWEIYFRHGLCRGMTRNQQRFTRPFRENM